MKENGICFIMEGNPKKPYLKFHTEIFQIKTPTCIAFDLRLSKLFIMDKNHNVYRLGRDQNSRELIVEHESTMKQILKLDYKPKQFDNLILTEHFTIFGSKIFYLYDLEN